jgi:chemotaxis protein histidine kinase CheA
MSHRQDVTVSTEPEQTDDAFQRELVELFGQEAREWLVQIHSALTELESQPDPDRHTQLVDAVVRGITSLGGSAATVNLSDVERTTFALLPFIDILKDRTTATKQDYVTVREQFRIVILSVTTATGITLDLGPAHGTPPQSEPTADLLTLLNALRTLQDTNVMDPSSRSLIPQVMQRLEQEARQGTTQIQPGNFHQILLDLQSADEQLLQSLREQLPVVTDGLTRLRSEGITVLEPDNVFGSCIQGIEHLQGIAKQANATSLVTFLAGLQSFLFLIIHRRVVLESQRLESVEARIRAVLVTIEGWIAIGNQERDAMSRLLPTA